MTSRLRLMAVAGPALLMAWACGGDEEDQGPPPAPVVIESARTNVLVGSDTMMVFAPTLFAYFVADPALGGSPANLMQLVQDFQAGVQAAGDPLAALGVRVEAVADRPKVLGLTPAQDAAAGPQLEGTSYGYVFVDALGHVRRVTSRMDPAQMVCAAATLFGLTLGPQQGAACG